MLDIGTFSAVLKVLSSEIMTVAKWFFFSFSRGVVILDIDLNQTSINQCDESDTLFSGSHKCSAETTEVSNHPLKY